MQLDAAVLLWLLLCRVQTNSFSILQLFTYVKHMSSMGFVHYTDTELEFNDAILIYMYIYVGLLRCQAGFAFLI